VRRVDEISQDDISVPGSDPPGGINLANVVSTSSTVDDADANSFSANFTLRYWIKEPDANLSWVCQSWSTEALD
jgi:hypothetical protein